MQDDTREHNPGRKEFWHSFYGEDGRLQAKEWQNRKSAELREQGSLRDHYEWFMLYPVYEAPLAEALRGLLRGAAPRPTQPCRLRVLHVGCGNSDLCDHLVVTVNDVCDSAEFSTPGSAWGGALRRAKGGQVEILNVDICHELVGYLANRFPQRRYAVGNCCQMVCDADADASDTASPHASGHGSPDAAWYHYDGADVPTASADPLLSQAALLALGGVRASSVDIVCDKGTMDALMSAFAGEYNPNVASYAGEVLGVLRPGGILFLISINAEDVVSSYLLAAEDTRDSRKSFQLAQQVVLELSPGDRQRLRVETLGSRYNCYTFHVHCD